MLPGLYLHAWKENSSRFTAAHKLRVSEAWGVGASDAYYDNKNMLGQRRLDRLGDSLDRLYRLRKVVDKMREEDSRVDLRNYIR